MTLIRTVSGLNKGSEFVFSPIGQEYPFLQVSEIKRIYKGVEA